MNANVHSQTWFWKLESFHMSTHVLLENGLSWLAFSKKEQRTTKPEHLLTLPEVDPVLCEGKNSIGIERRRTVMCIIAVALT